MNILVTGGAGFIGSHVVNACEEAGHKVRVIDDWSRGPDNVDNLEGARLELGKVIKPVEEADAIYEACNKMDMVVHCAAKSSIPESFATPSWTQRAGEVAFLRLLQAARFCGVKRIVFLSSAAVYDEKKRINPQNPYGAGKLACEIYARTFENMGGPPTTIFRLLNVYGPRQRGWSVIPRLMEACVRGEWITVYGDGAQVRDFIYVTDVANAVLRALSSKECLRGPYDIGWGSGVSMSGLAETFQKVVPKRCFVKYANGPVGVKSSVARKVTATRTALRFTPIVTLEEGLMKTWKWWKEKTTSE